VPIFSVDYKKAPEHPYPAALDDVWQAYNWILHFVDRFFSRKRSLFFERNNLKSRGVF